jgi:hypothetical protein
MAHRLALGEGAPGEGQGPGFPLHGAGRAAVGTGRLGAEGLRLLFQQGAEGAFGEAGRGGAGELLHGVEIGIQAGAGVAESAAGDDFAPAGSEGADFVEEFGGKFTARHGRYHLVLAAKGGRNTSALYTTHDSALQSC